MGQGGLKRDRAWNIGESRIDPRSKESPWSDPHETLAFEIRGLNGPAPGQRVVFSHDGNGRNRNGLNLESGPIERTIRIAKVGLTACDCVENKMQGTPLTVIWTSGR